VEVVDINNVIATARPILEPFRDLLILRKGMRAKRDTVGYLMLLLVKEFCRSSLRRAEREYSAKLCGERVDHSVIHYWEKRVGKDLLKEIVVRIGRLLEEKLGYLFSVLDSTDLTN